MWRRELQVAVDEADREGARVTGFAALGEGRQEDEGEDVDDDDGQEEQDDGMDATTRATARGRVARDGEVVFSEPRVTLQRAWSETTWQIQSLRDNPESARQEYDRILDAGDPGISPAVSFDPAEDPAYAQEARTLGVYEVQLTAIQKDQFEQKNSFMGLATNVQYATEVTLQPLARFPLDAAILFSDILTVPDPVVVEAMRSAAQHFVNIDELQEKVGRKIAEWTHNEAAYVSSGAAAGLLLGTAACVTGAVISIFTGAAVWVTGAVIAILLRG